MIENLGRLLAEMRTPTRMASKAQAILVGEKRIAIMK
jgi:hypothetical protein